MNHPEAVLLLQSRVAVYGIKLSPRQIEQFHIYLSELMDWGGKMNLIGLSDPKRVANELLFDSLIPGPFLPQRGKMLDVGSGAGIPGLPLKLLKPDLESHFLEPNSKKTGFLKHMVRVLGLEKTKVLQGRINKDRALLSPEGYDLITVRALTDLATAVNWCAPYIKPRGLMVHFLGPDIQRILHQTRDQIEKNNLKLYRQIDYLLPEKSSKRHILIFQKRGDRGGYNGFHPDPEP